MTFSALPTGALSTYSEQGFLVTPTTAGWSRNGYGAPGPSLVFSTNADASIDVTHGGSTFQFSAIDLYSSTTPIPYDIRGFLGGQQVFQTKGTQPNTLGNFATIATTSSAFIDRLSVTLTDPVGGNPMGLDNIAFGSVSAVPEPATWGMAALGVAAMAWRRRAHRTASHGPRGA